MMRDTTDHTAIPASGYSLKNLCEAGERSRSRGRALYRDESRAAYVTGPPPARGGDLELEGGVNVSL